MVEYIIYYNIENREWKDRIGEIGIDEMVVVIENNK